MQLHLPEIKQAYILNNYVYYNDPYKLNIFALRGYGTDGFHLNKGDVFDDTVGISYRDKYDNEQCLFLRATTDPSSYYFDHLLNVNGVAIITNDQFIEAYQLGLHRGLYEALVQAKPISVWRKKKELDYDYKDKKFVGMFGINMHKTIDDAEVIGTASAGCIVFNDTEEFNLFLALCNKHREIHGNKFTLTVFEEQNFKGVIQ